MHNDSRWRIGDRGGFKRLEARAYLAHAAIAPLSDEVVDAMQTGIEDSARRGLAAIGPYIEAASLARERFALLIGAEAREIARVPSTSAGISAIATGLCLSAGDRLVCFEGEFPTNVSPWQAVARRVGAHVELVPLAPFERSHAEGLEALDRVLESGARVVAASAVQFQTGFAMPLADMATRAHAAGALFFVDAIQAVGSLPLDVHRLGIDALAAAGHKWLMGPLGAAYLFVGGRARAELDPLQVGWMSHVEPDAYLFAPGQLRYDRPLSPTAGVFEQGVLAFANYAGSAAALLPLLALGSSAIAGHIQRYHDALEPQLEALGCTSLRSREAAGRSSILSFAPPPNVATAAVVAGLAEHGIVITGPDGCLRFAPHWPNALHEVDLVADSVARVLHSIQS